MALLVHLSGLWGHYRVIGTNHSTCMTYPTPPRTALLGKLGAVLGISYMEVMEKWEPIIETGFMWTSQFTEEVVVQKRFKLEKGAWAETKNMHDILKNIFGWKSKGKPFDANKNNTLDSVSYLRPLDINKRLTATLFIKCDTREQVLLEAFNKPIYPITFGTAEALASITLVKRVEAEKIEGPVVTASSVPSQGQVDGAFCSRLPRRAVGYKQGRDFVTVWTPHEGDIQATPLFGAYMAGGKIFGVM